jgi:hypothetical protein
MLKNLLLSVSIILLLFGITPFQGTGQPITTRCGEEKLSLAEVRFSGLSQPSRTQLNYAAYQTNERTSTVNVSSSPLNVQMDPLEIRVEQPLQLSDQSLVYLSYRPEGRSSVPYTLNVLQPDNLHLRLTPDQTSPFTVIRLLAETQPGVISTLVLGEGDTVHQAEISWSQRSIELKVLKPLPLDYHANSGIGVYLQGSPQGRYVFHTEILKDWYVIYDLQQDKIVWQHPLAGGLPRIIWVDTPDSSLIAIVSFDSDAFLPVAGHIVGVDQNGGSSLLLDLEAVYGDGYFMALQGGVALADDQIAFWVSQTQMDDEVNDQLMLFNYQTQELTRLCITAHSTPLLTDQQGEFLWFEHTLSPSETRFTLVSIQTGDYRYITLDSAIQILPGSLEVTR